MRTACYHPPSHDGRNTFEPSRSTGVSDGSESLIKELDREWLLKIVGPRVRDARERQHFQRKYVAKRVGITDPYLARIERGTALPSIHIITKLSDVLKVSVDELLGLDYAESQAHLDEAEMEASELDEIVSNLIESDPGLVRLFTLLVKVCDNLYRGNEV